VACALAAVGRPPLIVFSGQHPRLEPEAHGLGGFPAIQLSCPGMDDPHAHAGAVSKAILELLLPDPPQLLIVQGDTSTALGGALAARTAGIALAHVEAGLRSHDLRHPWPEEEFRSAIDQFADLLFAPTELSAANLRRERVRGRIFVTGNSGIDALLAARAKAAPPELPRAGASLLVTCHRRENWQSGLAGVAAALRAIAADDLARVELILHPNPALAARARQLLLGVPAIAFRDPCGHSETIAAMLACDLVLSDSGGLQEEAAALGVPLLLLREKTERPEGIACGSIELVGTDPKRIVAAVRRRLADGAACTPALPFGDGKAGERIAAIIGDWLDEAGGGLSPNFATCPRQVG